MEMSRIVAAARGKGGGRTPPAPGNRGGNPGSALPGVFTPFGDYGAGAGRNRLRLGLRYGDPPGAGRMFDPEFAGERDSSGETAPILRLRLRGTLRF